MRNQYYILALACMLGLSLTSCNCSKKTTETSDNEKKQGQTYENKVINNKSEKANTVGDDEMSNKQISKETVYRVVVTFISIGEGPSLTAGNELSNFLAFQNENTEKTLARDTVPWGREGEVDYCFKLDELNEDEQINFVAGLRETLGEDKLIHIEENTVCRHIR